MKPSTQHDHHRRIGRVIAAIPDDPAAPHSVESLAAHANLSPFHFHRLYRALAGEGLAETVRRLRLAQAAGRLNQPDDRPMPDIHCSAGGDGAEAVTDLLIPLKEP